MTACLVFTPRSTRFPVLADIGPITIKAPMAIAIHSRHSPVVRQLEVFVGLHLAHPNLQTDSFHAFLLAEAGRTMVDAGSRQSSGA
jgi:hypothetical protein